MEVWVQVLYVLSWLVLLKFLQLSVYPALRFALGRLAYPAAFPGGVLSIRLMGTWVVDAIRDAFRGKGETGA